MMKVKGLLKGTQQGLLLRPLPETWDVTLAALEETLRESQGFFQGGRVIIEAGARELNESDLLATRALLETHGLELWVVLSEDEATQRAARRLNLLTRLPGESSAAPVTPPVAPPAAPPPAEPETLFVRRTLRSGQVLEARGDMTLIGDVNPSAELIAGGNIVVWGRVRGIVHAGALGDENAIICALDLEPQQLRIASVIAVAPQGKRRRIQPEVARLEQGKIIVEPWSEK